MSITPPMLRCHVLDTGYCLASEHHLVRGGARRTIECHSLVALLQHPQHGWLLWDTGYAPRLLDVTRGWPFRLYRMATPLCITPSRAVADQLGNFGLTPGDIRWIICSHFHADHIAGLHDFPDAQFIAMRAAYEDVVDRRGLQALRRAFVPALMPADFAARTRLLDILPALCFRRSVQRMIYSMMARCCWCRCRVMRAGKLACWQALIMGQYSSLPMAHGCVAASANNARRIRSRRWWLMT